MRRIRKNKNLNNLEKIEMYQLTTSKIFRDIEPFMRHIIDFTITLFMGPTFGTVADIVLRLEIIIANFLTYLGANITVNPKIRSLIIFFLQNEISEIDIEDIDGMKEIISNFLKRMVLESVRIDEDGRDKLFYYIFSSKVKVESWKLESLDKDADFSTIRWEMDKKLLRIKDIKKIDNDTKKKIKRRRIKVKVKRIIDFFVEIFYRRWKRKTNYKKIIGGIKNA